MKVTHQFKFYRKKRIGKPPFTKQMAVYMDPFSNMHGSFWQITISAELLPDPPPELIEVTISDKASTTP